jgi:hypothetical protein
MGRITLQLLSKVGYYGRSVCIHLTVPMDDITLIYVIAAGMQVFVLFGFLLKKK